MLLVAISCVPTAENENITEKSNPNFTSDGAWCWFSDPRAIYYEGMHRRTYSGWVTADGSIAVGFYDHDLDTTSISIIDKELQIDDHNNPSFNIDPEGRIMVFYSKHSGRSPMVMARSRDPENIDSWEPAGDLALNDSTLFPGASNTYTYTNICRLSGEENRLYLFWRGVDFKPNFSTSTDTGRTWSTGKILVLPDRVYRNRRPYLKVSTNQKDVIHFAFTDGHPRDEPTNSIYYMRYHQGKLLKADGSGIKPWSELPISPAESDLVYDATQTNEKSWIWDVAGDQQDHPVIVYSRFPNDSTHLYYYAIWRNNEWKNLELVNSGTWFPQTPAGESEREPNYSGGITLDQEDPSIVYLSLQKNGIFEIERWQTDDFGESWQVTEITSNSEFNNIRPFAVRNRPAEYSTMVLWMGLREYIHYTDYDSFIELHVE